MTNANELELRLIEVSKPEDLTLINRREFLKIGSKGLIGLTGLVALVESGCASQIVYSAGAPRIISDWEDRRDALGRDRPAPHLGIDIGGPLGHPVLAAGDSEVADAYWHHGGGNVVILYHGQNKQGRHVYTVYSHLNEINKGVEIGKKIKRGEQIGTIGSEGRDSGGIVHLHFHVVERKERYEPEEKEKGYKWAVRPDPKSYFPRLNPGTKDERIMVVCFDPSATYKFAEIILTYPVKCGK